MTHIISLLLLKVHVRFHHPLHRSDIWVAVDMEGLDELRDVEGVLPLLYLFEEAEVDEDDARRPTNTRRTMNINIQAHIIDHIIQMLRNHK